MDSWCSWLVLVLAAALAPALAQHGTGPALALAGAGAGADILALALALGILALALAGAGAGWCWPALSPPSRHPSNVPSISNAHDPLSAALRNDDVVSQVSDRGTTACRDGRGRRDGASIAHRRDGVSSVDSSSGRAEEQVK